MFTRAPFLASTPAVGDWLMTRPLGTVALEASDGDRVQARLAQRGAGGLFALSDDIGDA